MKYRYCTPKTSDLAPVIRSTTTVNLKGLAWGILLLLTAFAFDTNAQTIPSSVTVSGACLGGTYVLPKIADNLDMTGRPAYLGSGTVTVGTTTTQTDIAVFYQASGGDPAPAWVLAFGGQPYQYIKSTATLPPTTGYTAVTDQSIGTCSGSTPLLINYSVPTASLALSATSVCSGSPFSVTATAANFSAPVTSYTLTSNPAGLTGSNSSGIFALNAPSVSSTTTYTLSVGAVNSSESASTMAVITVNPTPTIASIVSTNSTRCDVPNGQLTLTTNLPNGTYSASYIRNPNNPQTVSVSVTSGQFSLTGLSGGQYYGFSISKNGCTGTNSTTISLNNPTPPTVSITPSTTAICAGQFVQLMASGAMAYVWSNQQTTATISVSATNTYSVTGTASNGCSGTATASVTVNALPVVSITSLANAYCKNAADVMLTGSPANGAFRVDGTTTATFSPASLSVGQHTVVYSYTNASGCSNTTSQTVTVNSVPQPPAVNAVSYCQNSTAQPLSATASTGNSLLWYGMNSTGGTASSTVPTPSTTMAGSFNYYVSQISVNSCESPRAVIAVVIRATPPAPAVVSPITYCQNDVVQPLTATVNMGGTLNWYGTNAAGGMASSSAPVISTSMVGSINYYVSQTVNGCEGPRAVINVVVKPLPTAPMLVTASGQSYSAGVSSLTVSQNTGSVVLTVSGCSNGTISWNGGNSTTLGVATANTGTQTFTATCTTNGCSSSVAMASVTVIPTTLGVLYRDAGYGNTQDNIIQPYLELSNASNDPIPYSDITVRYWFTSEGAAPPTNFAVYYAPLGAVQMNYVTLGQPRQGATGYVEYSFPGGGNLPAQGNSGPIENGIQKTDGSNFNELDDYSYMANYADYIPNMHITAYRKGVLFWGQEPATIAAQTIINVYSAAKDGTTTSQIQTRLEVRNEGNTSVAVSNLKVRYYFTSDNGQPANVYVDYADIGASNVQAQVVKLASPVSGADSYVELTFMPGMPTLAAQSSLGAVDFRLVRSDYGLFDQSNDYSYAANYGSVGLNNHITAYLNNNLVFGMPPSGAPARVASVEPTSVLQARVLGNPVVGNQAIVEIKGAEGQAVDLKLVDLQGRLLHGQRVEQAGELEQVTIPLGQSRGQLLLKVSVPGQQQQLKLIKP